MPMTIIAGYDGSDASRAVLRFATRLGAAAGGSQVLVAAVDVQARRVDVKAADAVAATLGQGSDAGLKDATPRLVGVRSAAEGLHRLAEEERASLVVVGTTHHGPLGRLTPGSVANRLLHGAPCPVAVVPPDARDDPLRTVAIAYDGLDESQAALRAGQHLALCLGARLRVVRVHEPMTPLAVPVMAYGSPAASEEERRRRVDRELQELVDGLPVALGASHRLLAGPAGPTLVEACRDDVDVLVTGSRGYGPARSVLLGSVSRHVVGHAPCPVIVVPRHAPDLLLPQAQAAAR